MYIGNVYCFRYHLAQYPLSAWVYDRYEIGFYTKLLMEGLAHYVGGKIYFCCLKQVN